jgi:hypothetical protein
LNALAREAQFQGKSGSNIPVKSTMKMAQLVKENSLNKTSDLRVPPSQKDLNLKKFALLLQLLYMELLYQILHPILSLYYMSYLFPIPYSIVDLDVRDVETDWSQFSHIV